MAKFSKFAVIGVASLLVACTTSAGSRVSVPVTLVSASGIGA